MKDELARILNELISLQNKLDWHSDVRADISKAEDLLWDALRKIQQEEGKNE